MQHPCAGGGHEAAVLEVLDEFSRGHETTLGMHPTQQRLGAHDRPIERRHDRLIVQDELLLVDGSSQLVELLHPPSRLVLAQ